MMITISSPINPKALLSFSLSERNDLVTNPKFYRIPAWFLETQKRTGFLIFLIQEVLYV